MTMAVSNAQGPMPADADLNVGMQICEKCLGIPSVHLTKMRDGRVVTVLKTIAHLSSTQQSFDHFARNATPTLRSEQLEAVGGQDQSDMLKTATGDKHTIGTFAEALALNVMDYEVKFASAFNEILSLYKMETLRNLAHRMELQEDGEPLPEEDMNAIMDVPKMNEAAKVFCVEDPGWLNSSRCFLLNVQKSLFKSTQGRELLEQLHDEQQKAGEVEQGLRDLDTEVAKLKGDVEHNASLLSGMIKHKGSKEDFVKYLKCEVDRVDALLKDTQQRVKNYTWNMYGSNVYMWENDVNLAKSQCTQYQNEKLEFERRINQASDDACTSLEKDISELQGKKQRFESELSSAEGRRASKQSELNSIQTEMKTLNAKLVDLLKTVDAVSVKHLLAIQNATESWAKNNAQMAKSSQVLQGPWRKQLGFLASMMTGMLKAKTLSKQMKFFQKLVDVVKQKNDPVATFFRQAQVQDDLTGSALTWNFASDETFVPLATDVNMPAITYSEPPLKRQRVDNAQALQTAVSSSAPPAIQAPQTAVSSSAPPAIDFGGDMDPDDVDPQVD